MTYKGIVLILITEWGGRQSSIKSLESVWWLHFSYNYTAGSVYETRTWRKKLLFWYLLQSEGAASPASSHSSQFDEMIAARRRRMALDKEVSSQPFEWDFELSLCKEKLCKNEKKIFSSISSLPNLFSFFFSLLFFRPVGVSNHFKGGSSS